MIKQRILGLFTCSWKTIKKLNKGSFKTVRKELPLICRYFFLQITTKKNVEICPFHIFRKEWKLKGLLFVFSAFCTIWPFFYHIIKNKIRYYCVSQFCLNLALFPLGPNPPSLPQWIVKKMIVKIRQSRHPPSRGHLELTQLLVLLPVKVKCICSSSAVGHSL